MRDCIRLRTRSLDYWFSANSNLANYVSIVKIDDVG
jgi:hypothetical protein